MKASSVISLCLAAAAAGFVLYRYLRPDTPAVPPTPAVPVVTDGASTAGAPQAAAPQRASNDLPADRAPSCPSEVGAAASLTTRKRDIAETIKRLNGADIVAALTDSGLAASDGEAIARRFAADLAACTMASLAAEAARQSISVEALPAKLAASAGAGDNPFDEIDRSSVEAHALPCETDAIQRAGIPLQSSTQISEDDIERLRAEAPGCRSRHAGNPARCLYA